MASTGSATSVWGFAGVRWLRQAQPPGGAQGARHPEPFRCSLGACDRSGKAPLTFGLVNVPVKVYSATEDHDVLSAPGAQQRRRAHPYQRICEIDGEVVPYQDIDKAYDDGEQTVVLTKDDLSSLPSERSREIEVVEFVPSDQVDLLTLDKAYYLEPDSRHPRPTCCCARRSSRPTAPRSCASRCGRRHGSRPCACAATCSCCRRCCGRRGA